MKVLILLLAPLVPALVLVADAPMPGDLPEPVAAIRATQAPLSQTSQFMMASVGAGSIALAAPSGDIPASRIPPDGWTDVQWEDPGGWTTINVTNDAGLTAAQRLPANDSSVDASQRIQAILAATSGRRILYFPTGKYYFKTNLSITVGNLQLNGDGDTTEFIQQQTVSPGHIEFVGTTASGSTVTPGDLTGTIPITAAPALGDQSITVTDAATIAVGDLIDVFESFTPQYPADTWAREAWGQVVEVTSKNGNTLGLSMKLGLQYTASNSPRIRKINPLRNIQVKNLHLQRAIDNGETDGLRFQYTANVSVYNIKSWRASDRAHINIVNSHKVSIARSGFDNAWTTSGGGYAYGVLASLNSSKIKIVDNWFRNLRHHVLLQAGANHSVIAYNSMEPSYYDLNGSGSDLSLHGNNAHNNLFEGNQFYRAAHDGTHGVNGPRNTYYRNQGSRIDIVDNPTDRNNVIGNDITLALNIGSGSSANFIEGNRIAGTVQWQTLNSGSNLPASLYLTSKPAFLGTKAWPLYGPGVANYGSANTTPAFDR